MRSSLLAGVTPRARIPLNVLISLHPTPFQPVIIPHAAVVAFLCAPLWIAFLRLQTKPRSNYTAQLLASLHDRQLSAGIVPVASGIDW